MNTPTRPYNRKVISGLIAFVLASAVQARDSDPAIASINSNPEGQSYGRWAAEWWQWAVGVPKASNPVADLSGEHCAERQVDRVWFLAGSFNGAPVVRTCNVPTGKSLFFPLVNTIYGAFLNDPIETRAEDYLRTQAICTANKISVWIDDYHVPKATRYFTGESGSQSPIFNAQLPSGNVFGLDEITVPELVLSPSSEQGYYLFVRPLTPGEHTIRWTASASCGSQDITYHLTVGNPQ